jgi:hypothetical protein
VRAMPGAGADHRLHRRPGGHREDTGPPENQGSCTGCSSHPVATRPGPAGMARARGHYINDKDDAPARAAGARTFRRREQGVFRRSGCGIRCRLRD